MYLLGKRFLLHYTYTRSVASATRPTILLQQPPRAGRPGAAYPGSIRSFPAAQTPWVGGRLRPADS